MKPVKGKGRARAVAEQSFDAGSVVALDAYGGVDAEATGALPGEHAVGVGFIEQAVGTEAAKHTTLDDPLELEPVVGLKESGLMELDLIIVGL